METADGYLLNVFRIPFSPKSKARDEVTRPVVFLQHGLFSNSDGFLAGGPSTALGYLLADAGYDVWLGNARGNLYSRNNSRISVNHPRFWHFDWHEIALYDLPAMMDFITNKTGQERMHYVGFSQGTTTYFVLMSTNPEFNERILSGHMLAPCAFFKHTTSVIFKLLKPIIGKPGGNRNILAEDIEILPENLLINRLVETICTNNPVFQQFCENLIERLFRESSPNMNITMMETLIETHPAGSSSNQLLHYVQLTESKKFRQYDWGEKRNLKIYGQTDPPEYQLDRITAPTYFYTGPNDSLCDRKDVDKLVTYFKQMMDHYVIPDKHFNHLDFIWSSNVRQMVNDPLILNLQKHDENNAYY